MIEVYTLNNINDWIPLLLGESNQEIKVVENVKMLPSIKNKEVDNV